MEPILQPELATKHAVEQCEILMAHLRGCDGPLNPRFMRIHTLSLLGLIGDLERASIEDSWRASGFPRDVTDRPISLRR